MARSRLRKNYLIDKIDQNRFWYNEQRNKCVELLRDTRKNYYKK